MSTHEVFVYGSLKAGYWNNRLLEHSTLIGQACTSEYMLLADGPYPHMLSPSQFAGIPDMQTDIIDFAGNVYGEVWRVDDATLAELDRLEGTPHHYTREVISVQFAPHNKRPVFAYRAADPRSFRLSDFIKPMPENAALVWPTGRSR